MDARTLLRSAGWHPGRDIDVTDEVAALAGEDFEVTDAAVAFLREFSGLTIAGPGNRNPLVLGGPDLALEADSGWSDLYSDAIGSTLVPVGVYSLIPDLLARITSQRGPTPNARPACLVASNVPDRSGQVSVV